jgi:hypothetical protein
MEAVVCLLLALLAVAFLQAAAVFAVLGLWLDQTVSVLCSLPAASYVLQLTVWLKAVGLKVVGL